MLQCFLVNKYFHSTVTLYIQQKQTQLKATLKASLCSLISNTSKRRSLCYLGKNTHDHGNFRATHRTSPFHNRHTHSTCFAETRMSARHQCETTTWRHKTNFTKVIWRCNLGRRCRIGRRWSCRYWYGLLLVFVFVLAAAADVLVPQMQACRVRADGMTYGTRKLQATV